MTIRLIIALAFSLTFAKSQNNNDNDAIFKATWNKFTKAVLSKDLKTFKAMSTNCLNCSWCVTNTAKEDSLFEAYQKVNEKIWYDKLYSEFSYISIDKFINEDYIFIFKSETKSRMQDTSKLYFADDKQNSKLYMKTCIVGVAEEQTLDFKEVFLTIVDSTPKREGAQFTFAFVKIKGQYKFCGFSTIP